MMTTNAIGFARRFPYGQTKDQTSNASILAGSHPLSGMSYQCPVTHDPVSLADQVLWLRVTITSDASEFSEGYWIASIHNKITGEDEKWVFQPFKDTPELRAHLMVSRENPVNRNPLHFEHSIFITKPHSWHCPAEIKLNDLLQPSTSEQLISASNRRSGEQILGRALSSGEAYPTPRIPAISVRPPQESRTTTLACFCKVALNICLYLSILTAVTGGSVLIIASLGSVFTLGLGYLAFVLFAAFIAGASTLIFAIVQSWLSRRI